MSDNSTATRPARPFVIGGKTYHLHPFTVGDLVKLQSWVDAQYRNPMEVAADSMGFFSVPQQKHLMAMALELASKPKPKLGSEEADALSRSIDGLKETLFIGISKGDTTFTREDAATLFDDLSEGQLADAFGATRMGESIPDPDPSSA